MAVLSDVSIEDLQGTWLIISTHHVTLCLLVRITNSRQNKEDEELSDDLSATLKLVRIHIVFIAITYGFKTKSLCLMLSTETEETK